MSVAKLAPRPVASRAVSAPYGRILGLGLVDVPFHRGGGGRVDLAHPPPAAPELSISGEGYPPSWRRAAPISGEGPPLPKHPPVAPTLISFRLRLILRSAE
jgi:hypothetical protein